MDSEKKDISQTSSELAIDSTFDNRYLILEIIGRGGMSVVYSATDKILQRQVALKLLSQELLNERNYQQRFRNEALACSSLNHPNIVQILSFGLADEKQPYLVLEFLSGKTLDQIFLEEGKFSRKRFSEIFLPVLEALVYAHSKQIIHRDLKPGNIMVCSGNQGQIEPKVLDFGIAKMLDGRQDKTGQAATVGILGSPLYMSPEQCVGAQADPRSDIYSLACVMYQSLTGKPPFAGETALETMYEHLRTSVPKILEISGSQNISPELLELIIQALSKEPGKRPAGMAEFQERIIDSLDSQNIVRKGRKMLFNYKQLIGMLVFVVILVLVLLLAKMPERNPAQTLPGRNPLTKGLSGVSLLAGAKQLVNDKRYDEAIERYKLAIKGMKKTGARGLEELEYTYNSLGFLYRQLGKYDLAVQEFQSTIDLYPSKASTGRLLAVTYLAESLEQQGKIKEADLSFRSHIAAAEQALSGEASSDLASVYSSYASFLYRQDRYREALKAALSSLANCDRVQDNTGSTAVSSSWIAFDCWQKLGDAEKGHAFIKKIKSSLINAKDEDNAEPLCLYAAWCIEHDRYGEAQEIYELALRRLPQIRSPANAKKVKQMCQDGMELIKKRRTGRQAGV